MTFEHRKPGHLNSTISGTIQCAGIFRWDKDVCEYRESIGPNDPHTKVDPRASN
jgi:hypothetical protein